MRIGPDRIIRLAIGGGLLLLLLAAIGVFETPLPAYPLGFNRFKTPEISGSRRFSQRFFINDPNLIAIVIRPVAVGDVEGVVQLELRQLDGAERAVVRGAEVSAADLVRGDSYRFQFEPIRISRGRLYELDVFSSARAPSKGVALWATKSPRFNDGFLSVNGVERFANLAYQTVVPMPPRRRLIPLALVPLAISWIALVFLVRELAA